MVERIRNSRVLLHALGVVALGLSLLAFHAGQFHLDRLHVDDLNDQVGYITTARHWVDTGELTSHLIYPAFLEQGSFRFYMPGHYTVLALAYLAGGDGALVWRLPGMIAFVIIGLSVFLAGRHLYGTRAGWLGALLFYALPASIGLAFSAMSEPTTAAACLVAVVAFLLLPERRRPLALPLLLALPFLFRETTALLILPLGGLIALGGKRPSWRTCALACGASVAVFAALYAWQLAEGKWTPPVGSWESNDPGYASITAVALKSEVPPLGERLGAIARNVIHNAGDVARNTTHMFTRRWAPSNVVFVLCLHVLALGYGLMRRPREPFAIGTAFVGIGALLVFLAFHHAGTAHVLLRQLFWTHPLACVAVGGLLSSAIAAARTHLPHPSLRVFPGIVALGLVAIIHTQGVKRIARRVANEEQPLWTTRLEALNHDDDRMLVSAAGIALDYVLKHYPVRWAFLPSDDATLRALERRFDVGTIVVQRKRLRAGISGTVLANRGYEQVQEIEDKTGKYLVFRKVSDN